MFIFPKPSAFKKAFSLMPDSFAKTLAASIFSGWQVESKERRACFGMILNLNVLKLVCKRTKKNYLFYKTDSFF
jgi:hypothetical protein